jgi:hypothetical protein
MHNILHIVGALILTSRICITLEIMKGLRSWLIIDRTPH